MPFRAGLQAPAAENVNVSLISLSVQIDPAQTSDDFGLDHRLSFTTLDQNNINNEVALSDGTTEFDHAGLMLLEDVDFGDVIPLQFSMDVPFLDDSNTNGVLDFLDPSVAVVNESTSGSYFNFANNSFEPIDAVWNRDAGTTVGTVQISLPRFGLVFNHSYKVPQFSGVFTFNRNGTNLVGQTAFTNVVDPNDTISGPLTLRIKDPANLTFPAGTWSGPNAEVYDYSPEPGDTLEQIESNYLAFLDMADGFPQTPEQDYVFWFLNVESTDANHDGILDLVQGGTTAVRPSMSAIRVPNGIEITVTGTVGQSYQLQTTDRLVANAWADLQAVSLTSSPQKITLQTSGSARYFQLKQ